MTKNSHFNLDSLSNPQRKPDVYFLVFDSYPGTLFLKDYMQYDNSPFNEALQNKGFRVLANPKSNYNRSAFSISATLNFEYLRKIKNFQPVSPKEYTEATLTVEHSLVPKVFKHYNYQFFNLSIFDIDNSPSLHPEDFLTLPEGDVLLYNTLSERLKRDLVWNLISRKICSTVYPGNGKKKQDKLTRDANKKKRFQ